MGFWYTTSKEDTVRPRGTRPHGTRTSLGHDFKKGSKIFEISDFGTQTSLGHDFQKCSKILTQFCQIMNLEKVAFYLSLKMTRLHLNIKNSFFQSNSTGLTLNEGGPHAVDFFTMKDLLKWFLIIQNWKYFIEKTSFFPY